MKAICFAILSFILLFPPKISTAQADINMSTHWYSRGGYNPAFIARTEYLYLFSNYRQQWVGIEGAPQVLNIQASEYVSKLNSAFGVSLVSDNIGASRFLNPLLNYAYRIEGEKNWTLSLGMAGGFFNRKIDPSQFEADVINDPSINYVSEEILKPDANVGLEFQNNWFIIGASTTHIFSLFDADDYFLNSNHRYGYVVYKNNELETFFYKLSVLVVNRDNLTFYEGNAFIRMKHSTGLMKGPREVFDFGVSYRSSRQMSFMMGILLKPNIRVGYAYDHSFIRSYYVNTTHEIMFEYRIPNRFASTKIKCGSGKKYKNQ
ncbi:MAG: PorP/SprF family type IX secretion system membrane protein [Bacteroidales bacterium]|nr:PorP/SprF family type IX secretion system membrane protein [Bacteroidales bacterium]